MAQNTELKTVILGGAGVNKQLSTLIATTGPGEQVEIKVTKRTPGNVRVTLSDTSASALTSGISCPLDSEVSFRLGEAQRVYLVTDEIVTAQVVDVIIQPYAMIMSGGFPGGNPPYDPGMTYDSDMQTGFAKPTAPGTTPAHGAGRCPPGRFCRTCWPKRR